MHFFNINLTISISCYSFSRGREEKTQWQNDKSGTQFHFITIPKKKQKTTKQQQKNL